MSAGYSGVASFENCWHPVMHADEPREVLNVARCALCNGEFLPDIGQRRFCDRELCREVRAIWARQDRRSEQYQRLAEGSGN